jgi:hypothetical protein
MTERPSAAPSERTRVKRLHENAVYDPVAVAAILDAMPVATVAYVIDGKPFVTPTLQWREGDNIYWHGSAASRMLESAEDAEVSVNVMILDGLVLARSGFNHSVNYRSATIFGTARKVTAPAEKTARLARFMELLLPGRWASLRPMSDQELKATTILSLPISEASAKIGAGPPKDDEADYGWPVWAGVLPIRLEVGTPEPCPRLAPEIAKPDYLDSYRIG